MHSMCLNESLAPYLIVHYHARYRYYHGYLLNEYIYHEILIKKDIIPLE